jgi:hypothetical protein
VNDELERIWKEVVVVYHPTTEFVYHFLKYGGTKFIKDLLDQHCHMRMTVRRNERRRSISVNIHIVHYIAGYTIFTHNSETIPDITSN